MHVQRDSACKPHCCTTSLGLREFSADTPLGDCTPLPRRPLQLLSTGLPWLRWHQTLHTTTRPMGDVRSHIHYTVTWCGSLLLPSCRFILEACKRCSLVVVVLQSADTTAVQIHCHREQRLHERTYAHTKGRP